MPMKRAPRIMAALLLAVLLTGCADPPRIILTTGFAQKEVVRVDQSVLTAQEILVYASSSAARYADVMRDVPVDDVILETALSLGTQIKAMCLLAANIGVALSDEDREAAAAASAAFYATLTEEDIRLLDGITQDKMRTMYEEAALADKVYAYAIRDVNPEISDDEARTITVEYIRVNKTSDGALAKINEAYERIGAGEDFATLIALYNEAEEERASFGMGDGGEIPEEEAFRLSTGEISGIIETDGAYYILRCVSAFDREETRANKERIVARRRNEAFGELYDAFVETLPSTLNERAFEELAVPVLTEQAADFWEVYDTFFGEEP